MSNTCLKKDELEMMQSMLENYRKNLKDCTSTEEVVKINVKMDSWCRRCLSKAKDDNSNPCIDFYTKLRDVATADAVKTIGRISDGQSEKKISLLLNIYWNSKRVAEAMDAVEKVEQIASSDGVSAEQKLVLYYRQFSKLKDNLMMGTPTERLYIVKRWKNGVSILTDVWNYYISESPTEEEKKESSAKERREG